MTQCRDMTTVRKMSQDKVFEETKRERSKKNQADSKSSQETEKKLEKRRKAAEIQLHPVRTTARGVCKSSRRFVQKFLGNLDICGINSVFIIQLIV
ncbi:hypothetical protein RRG08_059107 [Elysia crispata]|uniref:Uncharacterized protein n=1 Tax=Elysia crispata TaxID=231223 RepID=A0AAE1E653_9GAST|nr:hypothetical protein RRG08_059107 [Elysia crispata]